MTNAARAASPEYYHMNSCLLAAGDEISGNGNDKVHPRIEAELEAARPTHLLSRRDAVYTLTDLDFSKCGITRAGYIYSVASASEPQRHDLTWIGPLQKAILKEKYANREGMKYYPDWSADLIANCCKNYWAGAASNDPTWEALFPRCTIIAKLSNDVIDPASTKGGWLPPSNFN